jgi:hypothetical protein
MRLCEGDPLATDTEEKLEKHVFKCREELEDYGSNVKEDNDEGGERTTKSEEFTLEGGARKA